MNGELDLHSELVKLKNDIIDIQATNYFKVVFMVEINWYKKLINWIKNPQNPKPSNLNNHILINKLKTKHIIKYKEDYSVIERDAWNLIYEHFGKPIDLNIYYTINPATNKPCVVSHKTYIRIAFQNKSLGKTCDRNWKFISVVKFICESFHLDETKYSLWTPSEEKIISNDTRIGKIVDEYPGVLVYKKKDLNAIIKEEKIPTPVNINPIISYELPSVMFPKPVGFINLGNTCFFNAATQCLLRVQKLTDFILSDKFEDQLNVNNPEGSGGEIAREYRRLLFDVCSNSFVGPKDPSDFRRAVVTKYNRFANYGQHDSQELLGSIIDGLNEDLNQSFEAKGRLPPSPTKKSDDSWKIHIAKNSSPVMKIFHGELVNSVTCPLCNYSTHAHDPFLFLSVPIPKVNRGTVTLEDCIDAFCEKEVLDEDNKWKCPKCNNYVQATKALNIFKCAPILIIHIKRFSPYSYQKVSTNVIYPDVLDLSDICVSHQNGKYRLIGAVFHHGSVYFGHYTSAALSHDTNEWYDYDDSYTEKITQEEAHSQAAYILFYERMD